MTIRISVPTCATAGLLACVVLAGPACSQQAADESKKDVSAALDATRAGADKALDTTKSGADKALDATKAGATKAIDATKAGTDKVVGAAAQARDKTTGAAKDAAARTTEVAGRIADTGREAVSAAATVVNDGWITTKIKAKFADEVILKGSDIKVDTDRHVVTLTGTVATRIAKARAVTIAQGTEGVARVVDQIVVRSN